MKRRVFQFIQALRSKLSVIFSAVMLGSFLATSAIAQDTVKPTIAVTAVDIVPSGKTGPSGEYTDFLFTLTASDNVAVDGLQYRARVNGQSFSQWFDYPYIPGFPLYFGVHCNLFEAEFRSVDTSDNISSVVKRTFRRPFKEPPGTPLEQGTPIVDPPRVLVVGGKTTILMKKFSVPKPSKKSARAARVYGRAAKPKPPRVEYEITFTNQVTQATKRAVAKKNIYTSKNLPSGIYAVSYKARVVKRKVVLAETGQSPEELFVVD